MTFRFDEERDNIVAKESQLCEADDRVDFDEPEHDGQPTNTPSGRTTWVATTGITASTIVHGRRPERVNVATATRTLGMATRLFFSKN